MKDDHLMNTSVSPIDGTRFVSAPATTSETVLNGLSAASARPLASRFAVSLPEESLVVDDRSHLTPAQMVETKLISRLKDSSLPVSHLQMRGLVKARYEA
jgi:hypothetical protein